MRFLSVVVIDDVAFVRDTVAALVRNAGHQVVVHAGDGTAGGETLAHRPDLVITDWRMPGMDGIEVTRQIRAAHPSVAIIAFTSTDTPELRSAFHVAGADALVAKGDVRGLVAAVRAIAARRSETEVDRSSSS